MFLSDDEKKISSVMVKELMTLGFTYNQSMIIMSGLEICHSYSEDNFSKVAFPAAFKGMGTLKYVMDKLWRSQND